MIRSNRIASGRAFFLRTLRALNVRLRFVIILALVFVFVGKWDVLTNYWGRLTHVTGPGEADDAVSVESEYFCPMCPGVLSDWPGKCSVCNMALVRRKKGEAAALPDGIVARMQFSPSRIQLTGIRTALVAYLPLAKQMSVSGIIRRFPTAEPPFNVEAAPPVDNAECEVFERDVAFWFAGQTVEVAAMAFPDHAPFTGEVRGLAPSATRSGTFQVVVEISDPQDELLPGMAVTVRFNLPLAAVEPFRSLPSNPPKFAKSEPREVFVCPDHPETVYDRPGRCPKDKLPLEPRPLAAHQRLDWWCPIHPKVVSRHSGDECEECGGMNLLPRVTSYQPPGEVLVVPAGAVVDTGEKQLVYVETAPGMFDGIEVKVGNRCGDFYPVVRGLEAGQHVAEAGAFLIDAETRLNPGAAVGYFGASAKLP